MTNCNPGTRQYIGARYVPRHMGEWSANTQYSAMDVVLYTDGNSYTAKCYPPKGTVPTDTKYWALSAQFNQQLANVETTVDQKFVVFQRECAYLDDYMLVYHNADDAFLAAASEHTCIVFGAKEYNFLKMIDASNKQLIGVPNKTVLNFTGCNNAYAIYASGNASVLRDLKITGCDAITDYVIFLEYPANEGKFENIRILNGPNGMRISSAWYTAFNNIQIACKKAAVVFERGESGSEVNGCSFNGFFLAGKENGIVVRDGTTVNANSFTGCTIEGCSGSGILIEGTAIFSNSFNGIYFENCGTPDAEYPLVNAKGNGVVYINFSGVLARGTYTTTREAFSERNKCYIYIIGKIFIPANLSLSNCVTFNNVRTGKINITENSIYNKKREFLFQQDPGSNLILTIPAKTPNEDMVLECIVMFNLSTDTTQLYSDKLLIYIKRRSTIQGADINAIHIGGYDHSTLYNVNVSTEGNNYIITVTNSSSGFSNFKKTAFVTAYCNKDNF